MKNATANRTEPILLIDSHHGIYIPQLFAQEYAELITEPEKYADDIKDLLAGPDNEDYWEAWTNVLDNAELKNREGLVISLHQDEDLWGYSGENPFTDED